MYKFSSISAPKEADTSKSWLKNNSSPRHEVIDHWNISYSLRILDTAQHKTFASICDEWPILKLSYGYELVNILQFISV